MSHYMIQAFAACVCICSSTAFGSVAFTVAFHFEREAGVHDVAAFRYGAGVNDLISLVPIPKI